MKFSILLAASLLASPLSAGDYAIRCDQGGHGDTLDSATDTETGGQTRLTEGATDGWSATSVGTDSDSSGDSTAPTTGGLEPPALPLDCDDSSDCTGTDKCQGFGQVGIGLMYQVCAGACQVDTDCATEDGESCVAGQCYVKCTLNQNNVNTCPGGMVCATVDLICVYPA